MFPSPPLPLVRSIALEDPLDALAGLAGRPYPFLFHSALEDDRARWSFFGADPFALHRGGDWEAAVLAWRRLAERTRREDGPPPLVPFTGGAAGYWSYDFGRRFERLRAEPGMARARDDLGLPDFVLAFYDVVGAFDHRTRDAWLFSSGLPLEGNARAARAASRLDEFERRLEGARAAGSTAGARISTPGPNALEPGGGAPAGGRITPALSHFDADAYRRAIETVQDRIRRGDIFQANLSQRWTLPHEERDPTALAAALHRSLARRSPAPYAAFFGAEDHAVASASPERFLELRGRRVETRPIKGTRPRGAEPADDARLAAELRTSAKDRAENVMIVDVLRNDLGRVCETGSVEVPELCALESFPQVHHLVSTVTGILGAECDAFDLLRACFPGGSITGAPKIRAMEILEQLEPVRRHIYTGSLGYVDWRGDADWNIAIRTALVTRAAVHFAAGGGITADSDPEAEYRETLDKAEGLRQALSELFGSVAIEPAAARTP
jgi:para-aminobenzoate synthetase component 1